MADPNKIAEAANLAKEIEKDIEEGIYDKEIKHETTEMSSEKRERLAKYFSENHEYLLC